MRFIPSSGPGEPEIEESGKREPGSQFPFRSHHRADAADRSGLRSSKVRSSSKDVVKENYDLWRWLGYRNVERRTETIPRVVGRLHALVIRSCQAGIWGDAETIDRAAAIMNYDSARDGTAHHRPRSARHNLCGGFS
jgi:hypothetical protein